MQHLQPRTPHIVFTKKTTMRKAEKLQSGIAIGIAMVALFVSLWQGVEERRHNRLSVKPILTFDHYSEDQNRHIIVSNNGLGPAIVQQFTIIDRGQAFDAKDGNPWEFVLEQRNLRDSMFQMFYFQEMATIKADESFTLLSWKAKPGQELDFEIMIEYTSMYEDEFVVQSEF